MQNLTAVEVPVRCHFEIVKAVFKVAPFVLRFDMAGADYDHSDGKPSLTDLGLVKNQEESGMSVTAEGMAVGTRGKVTEFCELSALCPNSAAGRGRTVAVWMAFQGRTLSPTSSVCQGQ